MSYKPLMRSLSSSKVSSNNARPSLAEIWHYPEGAKDAKFLRTWLISDSRLAALRQCGPLNWNFAAGLLLAAGVSAGFWFAVGWAISRFA